MTAMLPSGVNESSANQAFAYEAVDGAHKVKGVVEASGSAAAAGILRAQGLVPLSITPAGAGFKRELHLPGTGNRLRQRDLAVFARQFATLTGSGLSLLRSLSVLEQQATHPVLARTLVEVRSDIESGTSLSDALARHDRIFPRLMIAMVRAGETGGFLDGALERVAIMTEKDAALRGRIKTAMTYPAIVLAFSVLMVAIVLVFIVPVFEKMFAQLGGSLPLPTQIIVDFSHAMAWLAPLAAIVTTALVMGLKYQLRRNADWRLRFDRAKLRLPVFGPLFTKIAISRFARTLGTLLDVGVPAMQALDVVGETSGSAVIAATTDQIKESIRSGRPLSDPLTGSTVFPPMVGQMVEVGEESGQISAMLDKIADFYEREVDEATESLTAAIEPVMVVGMGAIVGSMVICLYLPMFTIYQHIAGAS